MVIYFPGFCVQSPATRSGTCLGWLGLRGLGLGCSFGLLRAGRLGLQVVTVVAAVTGQVGGWPHRSLLGAALWRGLGRGGGSRGGRGRGCLWLLEAADMHTAAIIAPCPIPGESAHPVYAECPETAAASTTRARGTGILVECATTGSSRSGSLDRCEYPPFHTVSHTIAAACRQAVA